MGYALGMSRRKVSTTKTTRGILGSTTVRYVHEPRARRTGPSRTSRFARFTGISPWDRKRFCVSSWVFVFLMLVNAGSADLWFVLLTALAYGGWKWNQHVKSRPAPVEPVRPAVGPIWCDHCAEWTIHETEQH